VKKFLKIMLIIILALFTVTAAFGFYLTQGLESGAKLKLSGVAPSSIKDGVYEGTYNSGRWSNQVAVTIKSGKITDIKCLKDVTFNNEKTSAKLFSDVVKAQNSTVDTVSGATVTSKAYLKAIENALAK
jgi:uncharacterized protein with FMN-binding domain